MSRLVIVTASTNPNRAVPCMASWGLTPKIVVLNGPKATASKSWLGHVANAACVEPKGGNQNYLGTVPAFMLGVDYVLEYMPQVEIIACLHDDVEIQDVGWAEKVLLRFDRQQEIGLAGFGGAIGLGDEDLYKKPYDPVQLARKGFRSNLVDAEVHGARSLLAERVACLDGFSQIGRRDFWEGALNPPADDDRSVEDDNSTRLRPWHVLTDLGFMHHFYDGALGCIAARYSWETWYLPIRCRHLGGQTAVGDQGYQDWAKQQTPAGDQGFWEQAHKAGYDAFRDVLPLRV